MFENTKEFLKKREVTARALVSISAVYFAFILNISFWRFVLTNVQFDSFGIFLFIASKAVFLLAGFYLAFSLLTWPYIIKPVLAIFLLTAAPVSYYMVELNVFVDIDMLRNVMQTNTAEALDLVTLKYILWILGFGVIPTLLACFAKIQYKPFLKEIRRRVKVFGILLLCLIFIAPFCYKNYASWWRNNREARKLINPVNYVYSSFRYIQKSNKKVHDFVLIDPLAKHKPSADNSKAVFVLVIGETARAHNHSLNGYERETNPQLKKENVIAFQDVSAAGTSTAVSVPTLFSPKGRKHFDVSENEYTENLLDLIKNVGYDVLWLENDSGCKGVCNRVKTITLDVKANNKFCDGAYCFDDALLAPLSEKLKNMTQYTFIVVHLIGSHGPAYYKRYPKEFEAFTPACNTQDLQKCTRQEIINAYDNTILYTDNILSKIINLLKKYPDYKAGMLYVSDHGESLGEKGLYLHSLPYTIAPEYQIKVPMFLWMSPTMIKEDYIDYDCLKKEAQSGSFSHDNIFHSTTRLLEIDTKLYNVDLDIFNNCRTKNISSQ